jgi:hypothetical protein
MGYFSIKKAINKQRKLHLDYQEATLNYIKACKKAGTWDEAKRIEVIVDQLIKQRYWL